MRRELKILLWVIAIFIGAYYMPAELPRFQGAIVEAFRLLRWYAREHVLLCLVPAFFIAGAIGVFVSQNAVMKYFGPKANKALSYGVASVSGTILAVCSCTVLPLFGSIYMRGAGLGPAIAFLYSGPAINILAIVLTARVLGWQLGLARAVGAVVFSVVIGLLMHFIFLKEERAKAASAGEVYLGEDAAKARPLWHVGIYFLAMAGILIFANWARPQQSAGFWSAVFAVKWKITAAFAILLALSLWRFFKVRLFVSCARCGSGRGDRACDAAVSDRGLCGRRGGTRGADLLRRRRAERVAGSNVGFREADSPPAPRRCPRGGLLPRKSGEHGCGDHSQ